MSAMAARNSPLNGYYQLSNGQVMTADEWKEREKSFEDNKEFVKDSMDIFRAPSLDHKYQRKVGNLDLEMSRNQSLYQCNKFVY